MRAWERAFRRASFRGVRFWVESEEPGHGRRVAVHEMPSGEAPITQDLGRRATTFRVSAYLADDQADSNGLALEAACDAYGPALLTLPMDAARMAHCLECTRNRSKDRNGYIAYSLSFVEAGASAASMPSGPSLSLGIGGLSISASLGGISASVGLGGISASVGLGGISASVGLGGLGGLSVTAGLSAVSGFTAISAVRDVFSAGVGTAAVAMARALR